MSNVFLGTIMLFSGNFAPRGWAFCAGQLLPINQDTQPLFQLIGTIYGGDGQNTFALPDLRSRVPIHQGQGTGLSPRFIGESAGTEAVTLTPAQMPSHSHGLGSSATATTLSPTMHPPATAARMIYGNPESDSIMATDSIGVTGENQAHDNRQPYLALNFVIALEGIFPSQ